MNCKKKLSFLALWLFMLACAGTVYAQEGPQALSLVGSWPYGLSEAVAADSARHLLFSGSGGTVRIYDVSAPASPALRGEYKTKGVVTSLYYASNTLYVANGRNGLVILDVSTPTAPRELAHADAASFVRDVAVSGQSIYLADDAAGVRVIPYTAPATLGTPKTYATSSPAMGVAVRSGYAYAALSSGLATINLSAETVTESAVAGAGAAPNSVTVNGDVLYLAAGAAGMRVYSLTAPAGPVEVGSFVLPPNAAAGASANAMRVLVSGTTAYLADGGNSVRILNVTAPAAPAYVGTLSRLVDAFSRDIGQAQALALDGQSLFVADMDAGLRVFNTSSLASSLAQIYPAGGSITPGIGYTHDVKVVGHYAYMTTGVSGVKVFDISDLTNPTEVSFTPPSYGQLGFYSWGLYRRPGDSSRLYLTDGVNGLTVINVSNPAQPVMTGHLEPLLAGANNFCDAMDFMEYQPAGQTDRIPYGFIANGPQGLVVVNLAVPDAPVTVAHLDGPATPAGGRARDIFIQGNYAYIAWDRGVWVVNIQNPTAPVSVGLAQVPSGTSGIIHGVYATSTRLYAASQYAGILVYDLATLNANANTATPLARNSSGEPNAVEIRGSGNYVYDSDNTYGFRIFDINGATPAYMNELYRHVFASSSYGFDVQQNYIAIADFEAGLRISEAPATAGNHAPVPSGLSVSTAVGATVSGTLTATDVDDNTLTYAKATDPSHGTVTVNANGIFTYTPDGGYTGADSFTYTVSDGILRATGTVTIAVGASSSNTITAPSLSLTTTEGAALSDTIQARQTGSQQLTYAKATDPSHGTVTVNANGIFTYTPAAGYTGADSFTYTVKDGTVSATGTVAITVSASLSYVITAKPTHGSVIVNDNGTISYVSKATFLGQSDSFSYTVTNAQGQSYSRTVFVSLAQGSDSDSAAAAATGQAPVVSGGMTVGTLSLSQTDAVTFTTGASYDGYGLVEAKQLMANGTPAPRSVFVAIQQPDAQTPNSSQNVVSLASGSAAATIASQSKGNVLSSSDIAAYAVPSQYQGIEGVRSFTLYLPEADGLAVITYPISNRSDYVGSLQLLKLKDNRTTLFSYLDGGAAAASGKWWLTDPDGNFVQRSATLDPSKTYTVNAAIKDQDNTYDDDPTPGRIEDPQALVKDTTVSAPAPAASDSGQAQNTSGSGTSTASESSPSSSSGGGGSGGGCAYSPEAGFAPELLLLGGLAAFSLAARRRRAARR